MMDLKVFASQLNDAIDQISKLRTIRELVFIYLSELDNNRELDIRKVLESIKEIM